MDKLVEEINEQLNTIIHRYPQSVVRDAMAYSLLNGGKRLRPLIFIEVLKSYNLPYQDYLDIACAIEMIHTYSLIHDDLPGMDNDNLRRGKNTCHIEFNEAIAILAGDGLLNESMNIIMNFSLDDHLKIKIAQYLYKASGIQGMIYGQELDMQSENKEISLDELRQIHQHKTGALLAASFVLGAMIARESDCPIWENIGLKIGLAFQIQDDILDVTKTSKELGKTANSDLTNQKSTYVQLLGIDSSQEEIKKLFNESFELLYHLRVNHGLIIGLFEKIIKRVY